MVRRDAPAMLRGSSAAASYLDEGGPIDGSRAAGLNLAVSDPTADVDADAADPPRGGGARRGSHRGRGRERRCSGSRGTGEGARRVLLVRGTVCGAPVHGGVGDRRYADAQGCRLVRRRATGPGHPERDRADRRGPRVAQPARPAVPRRQPTTPAAMRGASRDGLARLEAVVDHTGRDPAATAAANPVTGAVRATA